MSSLKNEVKEEGEAPTERAAFLHVSPSGCKNMEL